MRPPGHVSEKTLAGWGNFPSEVCQVSQPDSLNSLELVVRDGESTDYIPRGLGRAYGDSALNRERGVIQQTSLHRLLSFNETSGLLECEAGVSLEDIINVFLPRGWFLPTTPGTKFVTVGGAIAADVHGKNHHVDSSFGAFVQDFRLLLANGDIVTCSATERSELFWATVGGMGLTGCIVSARIQLMRVESAYVDVTYRRMMDLDATLEAFEATNRDYRYSVAWIDCLASNKSLGRSVLMLANNEPLAMLPAGLRNCPLVLPQRRGKSIPFQWPQGLLNAFTVGIFNGLYFRANPDRRRLLDFDKFFYPLDGILHWNRIYGRRGFVQYQALFPPETSREGLVRLLEKVAASGRASFLAVLKATGAATQGLLSFPKPGHTLALDIPNTGGDLRPFLRTLDELLLKQGGRLYLAKDATMAPDVFQAMYPDLEKFRKIKAEVDPHNRFSSSQARRLGIMDAL